MSIHVRPLRIAAMVLFVALWLVTARAVLSWPTELVFGGDANAYSESAIHVLQEGFYSYDGVTPNIVREPGESLLLAIVYGLFGINNALAVFAVHGLIFLMSALFFTREFERIAGVKAADCTLFLLLAMPSVFHAIVSLNREAFALSLFLCVSACTLKLACRQCLTTALFIGLLLGMLILTYVPYLLFPPFLAMIFWGLNIRQKYMIGVVTMAMLCLVPWAIRNMRVVGSPCLTGCYRSNVQWYVRGEMAADPSMRGLEPFWCLWSEYISRDWTGRSSTCSLNAVMHRGWPNGPYLDERDTVMGDLGKSKILENFPQYLWHSVFEVLEFHLPYVDFWGRTYNLLSAFGTLMLYIGVLLSLPTMWKDRRMLVFCVPLAYTVGIFILTDATPRYALPVIFCYAAYAGIGYARLFHRLECRRKL